MGPRRWILSSSPINGSGCIHDCYASAVPPRPRPLSSVHRFFPNGFIAAVSATAAVFFLVLTYYIILVRRRRADRLPSGDQNPSEPDGSVGDYHVWSLRTLGLNESVINSIPVKPYVSGGRTTADCSVCLGEFRDGELVRLLPVCDHAFHVTCIDTWLGAHINCPLCRANIIADYGEGGFASIASPEGNALTSDRAVSGDLEEDGGRERTVTFTDSCLDRGESSILGDSSDFPGRGLQPQWRSSSMDSLPETDVVLSQNRSEAFQEERKEQEQYYTDDMKKGKPGSSIKEDFQQKSSEEIGGGSTSGSGRMFFFSKYGRARSSSVLPQ